MEKDFSKLIKKINEITEWFDSQEELDLEEGIKKAEEGLDLVEQAEEYLEQAENKLDKIKEEHEVE